MPTTALFNIHDMQIAHVSSSELQGHCVRLPTTQQVVVDLNNVIERLTWNAMEGLGVGDVIPCVPLAVDKNRNAWRASLTSGASMRFLGNPSRLPGSSRATVNGDYEGRTVVRIDGAALGILDGKTSRLLQRIPSELLGAFVVGCPGEDLETGLVKAVLPACPLDDAMQLARVLCVWEFFVSKKSRRKVRIVVKTASAMLGVASASDVLQWDLPIGKHVTVRFRPSNYANPLTDTNCELVGAEFDASRPPATGTQVDAIIVKVQPYGAFCLVANGVRALMHRNDCHLDGTQDMCQHFAIGDRIRGVCEPSDKYLGRFRFRFTELLERRRLQRWSDLF